MRLHSPSFMVLFNAEPISPCYMPGLVTKDGGALAMKVYGRLRDQHSVAMAQMVTFSKAQPDNAAQTPKQETVAKV